ncbi:hypothetical protein DPMN_164642 [Dreissena polymorpha]|uniref:Uncharacterized protein n=1 Tax=Dreissena polymorpha TaxID=45954 RepID=A0A9D4EU06_DREPO|nr:hypothetical protein DPMN_164642 [Dreissena polymorpha]
MMMMITKIKQNRGYDNVKFFDDDDDDDDASAAAAAADDDDDDCPDTRNDNKNEYQQKGKRRNSVIYPKKGFYSHPATRIFGTNKPNSERKTTYNEQIGTLHIIMEQSH